MARNKLHAAVGGKDTCNLHRWVLLKNLIFRFQPCPPPPATPGSTTSNVLPTQNDEGKGTGESEVDENDSFMFPDASNLVIRGATDVHSSEAEWLDSLLESLRDGGEDEFEPDSDIPGVPVEDDDDPPLSPLASPTSSSDDLLNQNAYYAPPNNHPYPVPYPPFHPPLVRPCQLELYFANSTPVPLQGERRQASSQPHVYIRTTDFYFDRYELDPLPFPDEDSFSSYNHVYQQC
ncbi:hypothetical protein EDC04DRAFT_2869657 [Pisolithus marmoratus]|nr:hypothetical protein EDC04DRAFT_2869657 [Pisolithus marmoratus]